MGFSLRSLQNLGNPIQALIVQNPGKRRGPNFPPADVFMTIHTTSQILLTVVEMENTQLLKSYHTAKLFQSVPIFSFHTRPVDDASTLSNSLDVHRALQQLSIRQQAVFDLHYQKGMTHQEIEVALELPLGTIKSDLVRGREILKSILEESNES